MSFSHILNKTISEALKSNNKNRHAATLIYNKRKFVCSKNELRPKINSSGKLSSSGHAETRVINNNLHKFHLHKGKHSPKGTRGV